MALLTNVFKIIIVWKRLHVLSWFCLFLPLFTFSITILSSLRPQDKAGIRGMTRSKTSWQHKQSKALVIFSYGYCSLSPTPSMTHSRFNPRSSGLE